MSEKQNQSREYDTIIGGNAPPPVDGVVLGGIEGVKSRLKSTVARERAAALIEALRYEEEGLDLLVEALKDPSEKVQLFAGRLLRERGGQKGKQALLEHNPWLLFTMLEDWKVENYDPHFGIIDPVGTAYSVNLYRLGGGRNGGFYLADNFNLDEFKAFLKEPQVSEVEALACWTPDDDIYWEICPTLIDALCKGRKRLRSLKALSFGDRREDEYKKAHLEISDISPILESYPDLEVLKLHGCLYHQSHLRGLRHDRLKTLIIETADISGLAISEICALDLPMLEYFELWMGRDSAPHNPIIDSLTPVLAGKSFPNLIYLGLRSCDGADHIVEAIVQSPIFDRLAVLDLSMGNLTDNGAKALLKCRRAINRLHTLNVSMNNLSTKIIQRLSKLKCRVISEPQADENARYFALYE